MLTRKSRRKARIGRRHLPRREKVTRRRSMDVPGIGAGTIWGGATTRNDSQLGKDCTNQQNSGINQVAIQAALATILNPKWQALMANMARNMANN